MYLLDTNVVSETRKTRPHGAVIAWMDATRHQPAYISAVTFGEIQAGAHITREQDPGKAAQIEAWLVQLASAHNTLPMDVQAFRVWARLMQGTSRVLLEDAMIAATAIVHDLTVVTRNVRDFQQFGVRVLDPFAHPGPA